jgi:hypothetical protein
LKGLALVALDDDDVDLLTRLRQRDDLKLEAVYHPDPEALVVRLAELVQIPVVADLAALTALPIDLWVGGSGAAPLMTEIKGRARKAGRGALVYIPASEIDEFLNDPEKHGVVAESGAETEPVAAVAAAPRSAAEPAAATVAAEIQNLNEPPARAGASAPGPEPLDSETLSLSDAEISGEESTPVTHKEAVTAKSDAVEATAHETTETPPLSEGSAETRVADGDTEGEGDAGWSLGVPSIELFYDPARLGTWLAESACRLAGGSAAVLWRRDPDGQRYTLVAYAPNSDALPTIPFPPTQLEEYVRAGRVQAVAPDHFVAPDATPPPFHFLAVPLPGQELSYGLLGVFRPTSAGDFPRGAITELSARASELGVAVERCFQFARMGQELRGLRYKERIRDLMLDSMIPESERWSRLLRFLIEEVPADFAQFYRLSDDGLRLSLVAVSSRAEEFEGWVSIPASRGLIGAALDRERLAVYSSDDHSDPRGLYVLPIRARKGDGSLPIGVIVLDNAHERTADGEDTSGLLETTASIMAPLLSTLTFAARA